MNAIVIEHVPVAELPAAWRERLGQATVERVTVRIEEEALTPTPPEEFVTDDPAFGIWRDREDMADVAAYVRKLRAPRYNRDVSRNEGPTTSSRAITPLTCIISMTPRPAKSSTPRP